MQSKPLQASTAKTPWYIGPQIFSIILLLIVVAIGVWLWGRIDDLKTYPIEQVKILVKGQYVSQAEIKNTIINNVHGGFFSVDVNELKNSLLENPWIQDVSIRRVWPNGLFVQITEQEPVARFGSTGVLSSVGDVFYPKLETIPQALPELDVPLILKDRAISFYAQSNRVLKLLGLQISKLIITDRLGWRVLLNNGMDINLCRDDVFNHFHHFITLYPKLIGTHANNVMSVNLCYPNGLAIYWRDGRPPVLAS